jgi:hypothetical protein
VRPQRTEVLLSFRSRDENEKKPLRPFSSSILHALRPRGNGPSERKVGQTFLSAGHVRHTGMSAPPHPLEPGRPPDRLVSACRLEERGYNQVVLSGAAVGSWAPGVGHGGTAAGSSHTLRRG